MPLTALLLIDDDDCAFSVLGIPIVEFQIRQAVAIGASHSVLMVGRMPPVLHGAIDRLRREGFGIDVARNVSDAIDFVHPEDRVVLIAPRVHVASEDFRALSVGETSSALAVAASTETARLDIIDAARRWTGWASFDGRFLRDVGATIGDWDLAPTILRKLLQAGSEIMPATVSVMLFDRAADRNAVEATLRDGADSGADGIGDRLATRPLGRMAGRLAGNAGLRPEWVGWGGTAAAAIAMALALAGWVALPAVVTIAALVGWRAESIMSTAVFRRRNAGGGGSRIQQLIVAVVLVLAGIAAYRMTGQWGCVVLAVTLAGLLALLTTPLVRERNPVLLADATSSLVLVGLGALTAMPALGLGLAAIHAALSVAARQADIGKPQP